MSDNEGTAKASNSGSLVALVFLVFLVLKLTGVIDWSWWWVTSPLWIAALAAVAGFLIVGVGGFFFHRLKKRF